MKKTNLAQRVVVTGLAPISSIGIGRVDFWKAILELKVKVKLTEAMVSHDIWESFYLHKIENFNIEKYDIDKQLLNEIKIWKEGDIVIDLHYLLAAAKLCLVDSRYNISDNSSKVGLVLAHENPGINHFAEKAFSASYDLLLENPKMQKKDFFIKLYSKFKKDVYELQTFMFLFHIAKALGIHGNSFFLNNACASGLYGIEQANMMIKLGHCAAVIVAVADHPDVYKYLWFKSIGLYSPDDKIKPFSNQANGLVFGDGAAAIMLESLESALARKATIYAEYLGGAFQLEGWKVAWPAVSDTYYQDTINLALKRTSLKHDDIDLVVPHGVGIKISDQYESNALCNVFRNKKTLYSAFKPFVGHCLGASTLLETIILLLAMQDNVIPPTLNCFPKNEKVGINLATNFLNVPLSTTMKTASAFAGFDSAVIFKKLKI